MKQSNVNDNKMKYKKPSEARSMAEIDPYYLEKAREYLRAGSSDDPNTYWNEDDKATMTHLVQVMHNIEKAEEEARLAPIIRAEEQKQMELIEKQQKERAKRELEAAKRLPDVQFHSFADGSRYTCSYCHVGLRYEAVCKNPNCPAHSSVSIEPLMAKLRDFVNDYYYHSKKSSK